MYLKDFFKTKFILKETKEWHDDIKYICVEYFLKNVCTQIVLLEI